jgi:uncharacterized SAM-binding protein YcdF (DUF218 family)
VIFGAAVRPDGQPSRALRQRTEAAFACGGLTAHYIPTGAVGRYGPAEADVMAGLLHAFGVPESQITREVTGTDTMSSARACARLLQGRPGPVKVATSGYHILRCRMLLRRFGVNAASCPPPPASARWRTRWYWRAREAVAIPFDFVVGLTRR